MKAIISIFVGIICMVMNAFAQQSAAFEDYFVTPETYGCISGSVLDSRANADSMQLAIDDAIKTGRKLISRGNKKYYIGKSLKISGGLEVDLGKATIVATDTIDIFEINYATVYNWYGFLSGFTLDLNGIAKSGIHCSKAIKMHITNGEIKRIPSNGAGIQIDNGYEMFVDNIHFLGGEDNATGIKISTSDCHFSDCIMINCKTAIDNRGSNVYDRIHAWMTDKGGWIKGSVFYLSRGGESFLSQCCSDTFEKAFLITTPVSLFISQQKNFHNLKMWNFEPSTISAEVFSFVDEKTAKASSIYLTNSRIGGLYIGGVNRQTFTNYGGLGVIVDGCKVSQ